MTAHSHLLRAAAAFIRGLTGGTPSERILRDLMAQACDDAAGSPPVRTPNLGSPGPRQGIPKQPSLPHVNGVSSGKSVEGITDENIKILLHAGGMRSARDVTVRCYGVLLRRPDREWTPSQVAARTKGERIPTGHMLWALAKRNIIKRTVVGRRGVEPRYQAT